MNAENTKAQMRKGVLEYCILALISTHEIYASDIIEKLKEAKLLVVEGTLYPLLTRLKNSGLLSYNWVESASGPPRKYYKLTEEGQQFLEELHLAWQELIETVNTTTKKPNNTNL
jgi:PadR family transcriptional regulator PadR